MNTDFRVAVDFFTHHKARKLKKRLGAAAVLSLLQLWAYAAKLRTDGSLSGMSAEDIELAAEWDGEDGAFVATLEEIGFIDVQRPSDERRTNADVRQTFFDGAEIRLHDWADHNQWAADYDDRRDKARFSRLATVNRKAFEKLKSQGVTAISKNDYDMLTKAQRPSDERRTNADAAPTPSPSPSPAPTYKEICVPPLPPTEQEACVGEDSETPLGESPDLAFDDFFEGYPLKHRGGRSEAVDNWTALAKRKALPGLPRMLATLSAWLAAEAWAKEGGRYVPTAANFLKKEYWHRSVPEAVPKNSMAVPTAYTVAQKQIENNDKLAQMVNEHRREQHGGHYAKQTQLSGDDYGNFGPSSPALPAGGLYPNAS